MKTFKTRAAQGEIQIIRVGDVTVTASAPKGFTPLSLENGKRIIGHSETGHHHVLDGEADVFVMDRPPEGMRILRAIVANDTPLVHLRDYDTHAPIMLSPGEYEFRIGREYDPYAELARQQMD
jgi:hypothetical protein